MKAFVYDAARCNGCYSCQIACKDEHVGNDWMPYAKPQPDIGHFWLKMGQKVHGQVPKVKLEYTLSLCNHCADAPCMAAAPEAVYRRDDGLVIIDPEKAEGMRELVDACPYGSIYWNEELSLPQKCTGCAHLVDSGEEPRCVGICPTGALRFGDEEELAEEIARAEARGAEAATGPRVYYLNAPKLFISGDVWDAEANEVIEGASVTLVSSDGTRLESKSDDLGDFWFRQLDEGAYGIVVEAAGYETRRMDGIDLTESLNVGDFPMARN